MFRKRNEITVETDGLIVIRGNKHVVAWCMQCERHREMLATDEGALTAHVKSSTIFSGPSQAEFTVPKLLKA